MKCLICKKFIVIGYSKKLKVCIPCLEGLVAYQDEEITKLKNTLVEATESNELMNAQGNHILDELKQRTGQETFYHILENLQYNPFNLTETDIC